MQESAAEENSLVPPAFRLAGFAFCGNDFGLERRPGGVASFIWTPHRRPLMTLFNRNFLLVLPLAALLSVLPVPGAAQVEMFAPDRIGNWYLGGGLGVLHEEDNPAIADVDSEFGAVFGGGYRVNP